MVDCNDDVSINQLIDFFIIFIYPIKAKNSLSV